MCRPLILQISVISWVAEILFITKFKTLLLGNGTLARPSAAPYPRTSHARQINGDPNLRKSPPRRTPVRVQATPKGPSPKGANKYFNSDPRLLVLNAGHMRGKSLHEGSLAVNPRDVRASRG